MGRLTADLADVVLTIRIPKHPEGDAAKESQSGEDRKNQHSE